MPLAQRIGRLAKRDGRSEPNDAVWTLSCDGIDIDFTAAEVIGGPNDRRFCAKWLNHTDALPPELSDEHWREMLDDRLDGVRLRDRAQSRSTDDSDHCELIGGSWRKCRRGDKS